MNDTNTPVIARTAMLAALNISQWAGRKFDRGASSELTMSKGAQADAARVNKLLMSKEALAPIQTVANEVRAEFYRRTMPWGDNGERILPALSYQEFAQYVSDKQREFESAVAGFIGDYKRFVEESRFRLQSLFDLNDYPQPGQIADKFRLHLSVRPIPTEDDFRVSLSQDVEDNIRQQVRADIDRLTGEAVQHLWQQVGDMLVTIRDRLSDPDARFKSAMINNFLQLVGDLDKLNVANDPKLDDLRNDVERELLCLRDPEALRKDPATRKQAVADTQKVIDKFGGLW